MNQRTNDGSDCLVHSLTDRVCLITLNQRRSIGNSIEYENSLKRRSFELYTVVVYATKWPWVSSKPLILELHSHMFHQFVFNSNQLD
jgi:hypothetical protein